MSAALLKRLRVMDRAELRFRAGAALRSRIGRARATLSAPSWRGQSLALTRDPRVRAAREALARGDVRDAHLALASHFATRHPVFPLDPRRLSALSARIRRQFPPDGVVECADRILDGRYDLLGYRNVAAGSPPDWHRDAVHDRRAPLAFWDSVPYLDPACGDHKITWEINRHQHFLTLGRAHALTGDDRYYAGFVRQLTDWMRANPPLLGTNWASMLELAFRCLSWTWALHFFAGAASSRDESPWTVDLLRALDRQLTHVEENLSRYFSPNTHLTGEALALYVAGRSLPELESSPRRQALGREILLEEAQRQVLPDGGHAERSAHYHHYSTDFYLLAANVARASADPQEPALRETARRQARFLRVIADDAGRLPLIGDDDGGQLWPSGSAPASDCRDTLAVAAVLLDEPALATGPLTELAYWQCGHRDDLEEFHPSDAGPSSTPLPDTGYYVSRNTRGDHLLFDCGPHGFLNGGHAHADALSIVLTVAGRPLLVDPGTATYTMEPDVRDRFRSTPMHNTVIVDGRSQSTPDGPFHWRTRTDSECTAWRSDQRQDYVEGRHHAFAPLVHARSVTAVHGRGWVVVDRILGNQPAAAAALWHFHPDWTLEAIDQNCARLRHVDGTPAVFATSVLLRQATRDGLDAFAPEYGRIEKGLCLESVFSGQAPFSLVAWIPADGTVEGAEQLASSVHPRWTRHECPSARNPGVLTCAV